MDGVTLLRDAQAAGLSVSADDGRLVVRGPTRCEAPAKRLLAHHPKRLSIEWLPAYAPKLNPDKQVWNQTKHADLANFVPNDVLHLGRSVAASLRKTRSQKRLLRSFFKHAELPL